MSNNKKWLTTKEVAEILNKTEYTIREYCKDERLATKTKKAKNERWLVSSESVKAFDDDGSGEPAKGGESDKEQAAKEAATIAEQVVRKLKADLEYKALKVGHKTFEDALVDAKTRLEEANAEAERVVNEANETAEVIRQEAINTSQRVMEKEEKVNTREVKVNEKEQEVKDREQVVNERLAKAVKLEKLTMEKVELFKGLVEYHDKNIENCRIAIFNSRDALYSWIGIHQTNMGIPLYDYFGRMGEYLDRYLENVPEITKNEGGKNNESNS